MQEERTSRDADIRSAREAVKKRRNKIANDGKPDFTKEKQVQMMEKELQEIDNERIMSKMPRLVEQKAAAITMEAADFHRSSETLRNIIAGYKKHFGDAMVGVVEEHPAAAAHAMEQ